MKNKWRNYAFKEGKISKNYLRKYQNRDGTRETTETSNCNSLQQSGQKQEEIRIQDETNRKKDSVETHQQGQQGIQTAVERRPTTEEENPNINPERKKMKKEKETAKEKKHEAKEGKRYEKLEDAREAKKESKTGKKK